MGKGTHLKGCNKRNWLVRLWSKGPDWTATTERLADWNAHRKRFWSYDPNAKAAIQWLQSNGSHQKAPKQRLQSKDFGPKTPMQRLRSKDFDPTVPIKRL